MTRKDEADEFEASLEYELRSLAQSVHGFRPRPAQAAYRAGYPPRPSRRLGRAVGRALTAGVVTVLALGAGAIGVAVGTRSVDPVSWGHTVVTAVDGCRQPACGAAATATPEPGAATGQSIEPTQSVSGASISVPEDGTTRTLTCDQTGVLVSGHHNSVTLTGSCSDVSVTGDHNQISIQDTARLSVPGDNNILGVQRVDTISLDGHHNHLTVQSGITRARPTIKDDGEGNFVATGGDD